MSDELEQIFELQDKAHELPYGPAQVALWEEVVRRADALNDLDLAYDARGDLMRAAVFSGRAEVMLVAFAWCAGQFDRDPERFDEESLLWQYKWVLENGLKFPEVTRAKLEELLADMERRYQAAGSTLHAVALARRRLFTHFGEEAAAREADVDFHRRKRDHLSDCPACVASCNADFHLMFRDWEGAVKALSRVLAGKLECEEQPHIAFGNALRPLFLLERIDEAKAYQQKGYHLIRAAGQFVRQHAAQVEFATLVGDLAHAKQLIERHLPGALDMIASDERFYFLLAAKLWCDRLSATEVPRIKIRLPAAASLPPANAEGYFEVAALSAWFGDQAQAIARRFDARNGTIAFQREIDWQPELLQRAT